jgi:hypothetical protein
VEPRAAQGAVMTCSAKGPFYRPAWRVEASGGRRWWSLTLPVSKSKKGEGSRWGTELVRGKRRQPGSTSLRLLTRTGGRPTVASGAAALAGAAVAQLCMEENDPDALGLSGTKLGQELGRL